MARSQQPCGSRPDRLRDAALCPAPDRAGATRPASLSPHDQKYRDLPEEVLAGCKGLLAMGICALPVLLGFVLPASVLAHDALAHVTAGLAPAWDAALNSLLLAASAAILAIGFAVVLAYARRRRARS